MAIIAASKNKAIRTRWLEQAVHNAFQDVVLADPVRGIFGATPVETMHAFCKGLIEHVTFLCWTTSLRLAKPRLTRLRFSFISDTGKPIAPDIRLLILAVEQPI